MTHGMFVYITVSIIFVGMSLVLIGEIYKMNESVKVIRQIMESKK